MISRKIWMVEKNNNFHTVLLLWVRCDWDTKVFPFEGNRNQNRDSSFINVYVKYVFEV